ncbi:PEP-CTERM sorting domain-containing protein [Posidoniimonas polymericola]|nr:PEP-CTERM sorting domain-containing protein [Posidoniimonas polymericola]
MHLAMAWVVTATLAVGAQAANLGYTGTHFDIVPLFPGGGPADVNAYVVAGWRANDVAKPLDVDGDNVYGSAGYAMFGTRFDYPNANLQGGNAFVNPTDNSVFPNLVDLPSWVSGSQIHASRKAGGWAYALIDDPQLTNGVRAYSWGLSQTPASTFQPPYVKLGVLDGNSTSTGADPTVAPAERWSFTVGANAPASFRVGVMTDGLDSTNWAPSEVIMQQVNGTATATTGTVAKNRFVDMHLFDVTGAQAGDEFVFLAYNPGGGSAGVSGFSFDYVPEPASLALSAAAAGLAVLRRRRA